LYHLLVVIIFLPPLTLLAHHWQEELEVPYEIKFYKRDQNQRAPKELLKIHPLGKAPVITDGDTTLAESGAIIRAYIFFQPSTRLMHRPKSTLSINTVTVALPHPRRAN
jgi:hypothetical protein